MELCVLCMCLGCPLGQPVPAHVWVESLVDVGANWELSTYSKQEHGATLGAPGVRLVLPAEPLLGSKNEPGVGKVWVGEPSGLGFLEVQALRGSAASHHFSTVLSRDGNGALKSPGTGQ